MSDNYQLLPDLSENEYKRLRADIAERGVIVPIELDEDGTVLDGHHRRRIAEELGVPCPSVTRRGLAEHEKRLHAVALNLARRQLNDAQRVILGRLIAPDVAEANRLRMEHRTGDGANTYGQVALGVETRQEVATTVGLGSGRTYDRQSKIVEQAKEKQPELYERMERGEIGTKDAARELRTIVKAERVAAIAERPAAPLPQDERFPVLYVDPPWRYEGVETPDARKIENQYPTMNAEDLAALAVPADEDCVLFLWVTSPKLSEGLHLLEAWGFEYRTCMVWVKDRIGMGYYARQQHELLLIGKRGSLPVPDPSDRPSSVITAPRGEHSSKPARVYELIERMYPDYRRCELFARTERPGWSAWGNQAAGAA